MNTNPLNSSCFIPPPAPQIENSLPLYQSEQIPEALEYFTKMGSTEFTVKWVRQNVYTIEPLDFMDTGIFEIET